jgi:HK97 family phage major capsid protein
MKDEIMNLLQEQGQAISEFKERYSGRVKELETRQDDLEAAWNRPFSGFENRASGTYGPRNVKELNESLRVFCRTGDMAAFQNAMSENDVDGGYLVQPFRSANIFQKLFDQSPMRRLCRVENVTSGDSFQEPVDFSDIGAEWVNDIEARPETQNPQLGMLHIPLNESYCLIPLSQRLIDDSSYDLFGWLQNKIIDKFARQEGEAFVNGAGAKQPQGFMTCQTSALSDETRPRGVLQYIPSGILSLTADVLLDMVYTLRSVYRAGASWLMSSSTAGAISKLKDGSGSYLWTQSVAAGQPSLLAGYPVELCETMPSVANGNFPIAFGNFKLGYLIADRPGWKFLRDPFSSKPFVLIYAYRRIGGGLANGEAVKLLKIATS